MMFRRFVVLAVAALPLVFAADVKVVEEIARWMAVNVALMPVNASAGAASGWSLSGSFAQASSPLMTSVTE